MTLTRYEAMEHVGDAKQLDQHTELLVQVHLRLNNLDRGPGRRQLHQRASAVVTPAETYSALLQGNLQMCLEHLSQAILLFV